MNLIGELIAHCCLPSQTFYASVYSEKNIKDKIDTLILKQICNFTWIGCLECYGALCGSKIIENAFL